MRFRFKSKVWIQFGILASFLQAVVYQKTGISYCGEGGSIAEIQDLTIDISSASPVITTSLSGNVDRDLTGGKVSVKFFIFEKEFFSKELNLCAKNGDVSPCPVQKGQFKITYSLPAPDNLNSYAGLVTGIPGSNFTADMNLQTNDGQPLGCAVVNLDSSVSARQPAIEALSMAMAGTTAILSITGALLSTTVGAAIPASGTAVQLRPGPSPCLLDVFSTFQYIAATGQLSVRLPVFVQQFTNNFAWASGVVHIGFLDMVANLFRPREYETRLARRGLMPDASAKTYSDLSGIASHSRKLGVKPENYFITVLFIFVCTMVALTVTFVLLRVALELLSVYRPHMFTNVRNHFALYYVGNLLRVFLLCYFVLATAALFQLTIRDYWAVTLSSVVVLALFCLGLMGFVAFRVARAGADRLYTSPNLQVKYGSLYSDYRAATYTFFVPVLISAIVRAFAVGVLSEHPIFQMCILVLTEVVFFAVLFYYRPYTLRVNNNLMVFIGVLRIVSTALMFAFIGTAVSDEIVRNVIGIALVAVQGLMVLAILTMTLWSLVTTVKKVVGGNADMKPPSDKSAFLDDQRSGSEVEILTDYDTKKEPNQRADNRSLTLVRSLSVSTVSSLMPPNPDADDYFPSQPKS